MGGMSMSMGDMSSSHIIEVSQHDRLSYSKNPRPEGTRTLFNNRLVNASISGTPATVTNDITAAFQELS